MVLNTDICPKILGILSQIYTLSTLRDDLTVLQHHPYQIVQTQRLENRKNSSYLAKREGAIATVYWDATGTIKAIFNMDISHEVLQAFQNSGVDVAQNVLAECERYVSNALGPASIYLARATWAAQLGSHWRNILRNHNGVATISILVELRPIWGSIHFLIPVLAVLESWFAQGGHTINIIESPDAREAGNAPGNQFIHEGSIIEERTLEDRSKSRFCDSPIQNSPIMFTVETFDSLLRPLITC